MIDQSVSCEDENIPSRGHLPVPHGVTGWDEGEVGREEPSGKEGQLVAATVKTGFDLEPQWEDIGGF